MVAVFGNIAFISLFFKTLNSMLVRIATFAINVFYRGAQLFVGIHCDYMVWSSREAISLMPSLRLLRSYRFY